MFNFLKKKKTKYKPVICILMSNEENGVLLELHTDPMFAKDPLIKTLSHRIADHIKDNYCH